MTAKYNLTYVIILENNLLEHLGPDKCRKICAGFKKTIMLPHGKFIKVTIAQKKVTNSAIGPVAYYEIPRGYAQVLLEKGVIKTILPCEKANNPAPEIPDLAITPYPYQTVLADFICTQLTEERARLGAAGMILELEAGLGKTYVAAIVIARKKLKTLYIVPNEYLLEQAADDFTRALPGVKIGKYYHKCKRDGDIVLMIVNSALSENFTRLSGGATTAVAQGAATGATSVPAREFMSQFSLVVFDEVHEYASTERSQVFQNTSGKFVLGLTAEANSRTDKLDFVCHMHIGRVYSAESIPGFDVPETDRYTSETTIIKYHGPKEYCHNIISRAGMLSAYEMSKQMIRDPYRTRLIVDLVLKFYTEGRNIFIWCDMRGIDILLCEILKKEGIDASLAEPLAKPLAGFTGESKPLAGFTGESGVTLESPDYAPSAARADTPVNPARGLSVAGLMGGMSKPDIVTAQNSRVIVATYQYAYRGVSLPKFDTMIFATPRRAKIYQTLKRIFRAGGDVGIIRKIVDIVDMKTKLKSQLSTRREQYVRPIFGMTIHEEKIEPRNIKITEEFMATVRELSDKHIPANIPREPL